MRSLEVLLYLFERKLEIAYYFYMRDAILSPQASCQLPF